MLRRWIMAFAITQVVEIPVYERALRVAAPTRARGLWARLAIAGAASTITHPVANALSVGVGVLVRATIGWL